MKKTVLQVFKEVLAAAQDLSMTENDVLFDVDTTTISEYECTVYEEISWEIDFTYLSLDGIWYYGEDRICDYLSEYLDEQQTQDKYHSLLSSGEIRKRIIIRFR